MPTHQTRSSAVDRCPVEPPAADLSDTRAGEDDSGTEEREAERGWKALVPELPDEVIALLAAPVSLPEPAEIQLRGPAPEDPTQQPVTHPDLTPRFLAPGSDDSLVS